MDGHAQQALEALKLLKDWSSGLVLFIVTAQSARLGIDAGQDARFFGLDKSGTHLYAANQSSDTIVIFRIDQTSGTLPATGGTIKVASPTTIAFR
jgi:6-phosphogluconolactonase (cycloisomerase 2 family)